MLVDKLTFYYKDRKKIGVAYLFWFLLGVTGAHRFYLEDKKSGTLQFLLLIAGFASSKMDGVLADILVFSWIALIIWLISDLFLIPSIIKTKNLEFMTRIGLTPQDV